MIKQRPYSITLTKQDGERELQPYEVLAVAVVEQACDDYIRLLRGQGMVGRERASKETNAKHVREVENFLLGGWCDRLVGDGVGAKMMVGIKAIHRHECITGKRVEIPYDEVEEVRNLCTIGTNQK